MLFTLSVALNEVALICQANNFVPMEHKPVSLSRAVQLCGHRSSLTHSSVSTEETTLHLTLLQPGLLAASAPARMCRLIPGPDHMLRRGWKPGWPWLLVRLITAYFLPTNLTPQIPQKNWLIVMEKPQELQPQIGFCWAGIKESDTKLVIC